jgi:uncharacterized phage protein (TIGR02220 family)
MAIFRKVHTQIWSDPFFSDLDSEKKIFYLYLLTNERTKQCGIYDISKKHIAFDLGISLDKVSKLISYFISTGKIQFSESTNEVALKNWAKYNYSTSPKVVKCIESELKEIKNRVLIEYIYSIDTLSQEEEEEEEEQEEKKPTKVDKINFDILLEYINNTLGKKYVSVSDKAKKSFNARLKDGYTKGQIMLAIHNVKNDSFHKENNYKHATVEYFSRAKTLDMHGQVVEQQRTYSPASKILDHD